jgi:alpha-D-ribose 1-methylphosphonate 5-triphosphate diphosphatase
MRPILIEGARALLPGGPEETDVLVADGLIASIGIGAPADARRIDARGLVLAPAMVDIHGDAFERQVMPRPGVYFPIEEAILETDRQLASNGIATAYHALTLSWEPGLRSVEQGRKFVDALKKLKPRLAVEHRIQLRWETFAFEAVDLLREVLSHEPKPSIAFNDHTSMYMRPMGMNVTERPHRLEQTVALDDPRFAERMSPTARRSGLGVYDYIALLEKMWERREKVEDVTADVAALGIGSGVPMLSHDDSQTETREFYSSLGARISEFPMSETVAREAKTRGEWVVLGAPNVVRGGSHIGSLVTADMIEAGICDILASDYFYPSMLAAIARLHKERRASLPALWQTVSANPARASHLTDRGTIETGKRADLVLLDWQESSPPVVRLTLVTGKTAYLSGLEPK